MGMFRVSDCIANRYEIYNIFGGEGKSGMGIVYVCFDHEFKELLALKTFQERYLYAEAHYNIGMALMKKGLFNEAIKAYEDFIKYARQKDDRIEKAKEIIRRLKEKL